MKRQKPFAAGDLPENLWAFADALRTLSRKLTTMGQLQDASLVFAAGAMLKAAADATVEKVGA